MSYNLDMQTSSALIARLSSIQRRADTFGKSREDVLDEISYFITDLQLQADLTERRMEQDWQNYNEKSE